MKSLLLSMLELKIRYLDLQCNFSSSHTICMMGNRVRRFERGR